MNHLCGGVAEHDSSHVDLDDVAGGVLLDAVAGVVELGEGGGHLVHELAQGVLRMLRRRMGLFSNQSLDCM